MRKFFICIFFLISAVLAAQKNINLIVVSADGQKFYLILDGVKQNARAEASVAVKNLKSGTFDAVIAFESELPDVKDKIYTIWEGAETNNREFTYTIEKKGDKYRLRFLNSIELAAADSSKTNSIDTLAQAEPRKCTQAMSDKEFASALQAVGVKDLEDTRLKTAKEILSFKQCMNTAQLKEVCSYFEYDVTRLNFLKYAYDYCSDPSFYRSLSSAFDYKKTMRDFSDWLSSKGVQ